MRNSGCRSRLRLTIIALELLYRHTLVGHAFLAIAEDNFAARALGLPERNLRMASYALAGVIGGACRILRRRPAAGLRRQRTAAQFLRLRSGCARRARQQSRRRSSAALRSACSSRPQTSWSAASSPRSPCSRCSSSCCCSRRKACSARPRPGGSDGGSSCTLARTDAARATAAAKSGATPRAADRCVFLLALLVPFVGNDYWVLIATRAAIYWVLVSGLNLVVGFAGQLAIGYVALLTLGAYTTSVLVAGNVAAAGPAVCRARQSRGWSARSFGVIVGLAGVAAAHILLRHDDARLCDHRHADRARLAERDRWRHRPARAGTAGAVRHAASASTSSASPLRRSAPG